MGRVGQVADQFDDLYRREFIPIATLATALTGDPEGGADIAHEAFLRAYRNWATVSTLDRPGAWVRRIAINLATDVRRKRIRGASAAARLRSRPEASLATSTDGEFWAAVRSLPDRQRAAIALRYVDDLTVDEIAEIMDISGGTVKATLFKARQSLAAVLRAEEVDDARYR